VLRLRRRYSRVVDGRRAAHVVSQSFPVLSVADICFYMETRTGSCQFLTRTQRCLFSAAECGNGHFFPKNCCVISLAVIDRLLISVYFSLHAPRSGRSHATLMLRHMPTSFYCYCVKIRMAMRQYVLDIDAEIFENSN
jgi:hypothetical protein